MTAQTWAWIAPREAVIVPGPDADVTLVVEDSEVITEPDGRRITLIKEARLINVVLH